MSRSQAKPEHPVLTAVGLPDAPVMTTRAARGTGITFLELDFKKRNAGLTNPAHEDAFLIALQLDKADDFDLYTDGRFVRPRGYAPGEIAIFDLRMNIATDLRDPFHAVNLYVPHRALLAMGDDGDVPRNIQELRHTVGATVIDPVARGLLLSIRPALARPAQVSELFVDHVALALSIHIACAYGDGAALPDRWRGGLAPRQERRAKELIEANLGGGVTLNELARACDLSPRHFTRAFRQSTAMSPHEWLRRRRLEKAKELLSVTSKSLSDIALECGFADQSHLTRTFSRVIGATPGAWRRSNCI